MWGEQTAVRMFGEAGFTGIEVRTIEGDPFNNYDVCSKPG